MSDDRRPADPAAAPRLGEILLDRGLLTRETLDAALEKQQLTHLPLGTILVRDGLVPAHTIAMALADQRGAPLKTEHGYATGHGSAAPVTRLQPAPRPEEPVEDHSAALRAELEQAKSAVAERDAALAAAQAELQAERAAASAAAATLDELRDRLALLEAERGQLGAALETARTEAQERQDAAAQAQAAAGEERARHVRTYSPERHVLIAPSPDGYELLERRGPAPEAGAIVELSGPRRFRVLRVGPAPFPGADEACAYLEPLA